MPTPRVTVHLSLEAVTIHICVSLITPLNRIASSVQTRLCSIAADSIRGDGMTQVHNALAALQDPDRLQRARARFDASPRCTPHSHQSQNSTLSHSPCSPSQDERRQREERRYQLTKERRASLTYEQFANQHNEEQKRIFQADRDRTCVVPVGTNIYQLGHDDVKKRWAEQGIWNNKWNDTASGLWKHGEPLELDSKPEMEIEAETKVQPLFYFRLIEPPSNSTSDEEKQRTTRERERESSRALSTNLFGKYRECENELRMKKSLWLAPRPPTSIPEPTRTLRILGSQDLYGIIIGV